MNIRRKARGKSGMLWIFLFTLLLAACASPSTTVPAGTTTTPKPTATPAGIAYAGTSFTLSYPKTWKESTQSAAGEDTFVFQPSNASPNGNTGFLVTVSAQTSNGNADAAVSTALAGLKTQISNPQALTTLPSTAMIAGDTWKQGGMTGIEQGQPVKSIILADFHSASKRLYILIIADTVSTFNQNQTTIFQPMLQSFKFV
jgi:hypothetical protein